MTELNKINCVKIERFKAYYDALPKQRKEELRFAICAKAFPDRNRSHFYNVISAKSRVYMRTAEHFKEVLQQFDPDADVESIFPTMKNNIQKHLNLLGVSQTELAKRTGLHQSSISAYVSGTRNPDTVHALLICKVLDLDFFDVFPEFEEYRVEKNGKQLKEEGEQSAA